MRRLAAMLVSALGCGGVEQGYDHVPRLDEAAYLDEVEPIIEEHCASPTCHGRPERPLALYAPRRYRRDPARRFLDEPLSPEEVTRNYDRACGFVVGVGEPRASLLWRKPVGRAYHGGGAVLDESDVPARTIEAWLWSAW